MEIVLGSLAFLVAALCAAAMGYAIQRGATCTVAAVDEVMTKRRCTRLVSMLEASLWVAGGLLIARALHVLPAVPAGHAVGVSTVVGGALLGLGAYVNRACVFGAVARFGSGEWAYLTTPLGFYLGCVGFVYAGVTPPARLDTTSPILGAASWLAFAAGTLMLFRLMLALRKGGRPGVSLGRVLAARVWSPHAATIVIGISFCIMLVLVGAWAYTDVLAELAHGMTRSTAARALLLAALLGGAALGGFTAGRFRHTRITARQLLRCVAGGVLMGWGSLLIPGGNDGLILVGLPLLWPFAWLAFLMMAVTIAGARVAAMAIAREAPGPSHLSGH
jgi:toxin CptA